MKPDRERRPVFLVSVVVVLCLVFLPRSAGAFSFEWTRLFGFFDPPGGEGVCDVEWRDLGPTPARDKGHKPQGLAFIAGRLVLAQSENDESGRFYVYRIDGADLRLETSFPKPPGAVHTSGLAWDGENLWSVDHVSHRLYRIDFAESLERGRSVTTGSVATGLDGTGSITVLTRRGRRLLAIADFMASGRTYLVPIERALHPEPVAAKAVHSYRNGFFVQGIAFDGTYLYETNGVLGRDMILRIDVERAIETGDYAAATLAAFVAPGDKVEDIATDGRRFWTTDEGDFRLFTSRLDDGVLDAGCGAGSGQQERK